MRHISITFGIWLLVATVLWGYSCGWNGWNFTAANIFIGIIWILSVKNANLFSPFLGLFALSYLYAVSTIMKLSTDGVSWDGYVPSSDALNQFSLTCIGSQCGLLLGALFAPSFVRPQRYTLGNSLLKKSHEMRAIRHIGWVLVAISPLVVMLLNPAGITSYADVALSSRLTKMDNVASGPVSYLTEDVPTFFILSWTIIALFSRKAGKIIKVSAIALLLLFLYKNFLSGWRSSIAMALVLLMVYRHFWIKPVRIAQAGTAAIFIYVLINAMSILRVSSDPMLMLKSIESEMANHGAKFLSLAQSSELGTSANLVRQIDGHKFGEIDYLYGGLVLRDLTAFIPKAILNGRPLMSNELYAQTFHPAVFEQGGGFGFFLPQEGYWDFGIFGAILYSGFFCYILEFIFLRMRKKFHLPIYVIMYGFLYYCTVIASVRSGMFVSIKASMMMLAPALLVIFFEKRFVMQSVYFRIKFQMQQRLPHAQSK